MLKKFMTAAVVLFAANLSGCGGGGGGDGGNGGVNTPAPTSTGWTTGTAISDPLLGSAFIGCDARTVTDAAGNMTTFWCGYITSSGTVTLLSSHFTAATKTWSFPVQLSTGHFDEEANGITAAVVDNSGNVTAVWVQDTYNLYTSRYDIGSGTWSAATKILGPAAASLRIPTAVIDSTNTITLAWSNHINGIQVSRYSAGSWSAPIELDGADIGFKPVLAVDGSGRVTAVWQHSAFSHRLRGSRLDGGSWSSAFDISDAAVAGESFKPVAKADNSGNVTVIWQKDNGSRIVIQGRRYNIDTASWTPIQQLDATDLTGDSSNHVLAVDTGGNATAAWQQSDGATTNIAISRLAAGATVWSSPLSITTNSTAAETSDSPSLAADGTGNLGLAWRHNFNTAGKYYVYASLLAAGESTWSKAVKLNPLTNSPGWAYAPTVAGLADGGMAVVWLEPHRTISVNEVRVSLHR